MAKKKLLRTVAVASLVAISSINLIGCTESGSEAVSIQVEQDATGGNGQKINEKEQTTKGGTTNEKTSSVGKTSDFENKKQEPEVAGVRVGTETIKAEQKIDEKTNPLGNTSTSVQNNTEVRTVIENGEVKVWAEHYDRDKTIKPTAIKYEDDGTGNHTIYYEVNGQKLEVRVAGDTGDRYFCEGGKYTNFASIGKSVKKSNEAVLNSYAANMRLNEEMKKKYK